MSRRSLAISYPSSLHVQCDPGYSIDGSSTLSSLQFTVACLADGTLSDLNQCQKVECGLAPAVTYTKEAPAPDKAHVFNDVAEYKCAEGYTLDTTPEGPTEQISLCTQTGVFQPVMQCEPVSCGQPAAIIHGTVNSEHISFPKTVTFACDTGYRFPEGNSSSALLQLQKRNITNITGALAFTAKTNEHHHLYEMHGGGQGYGRKKIGGNRQRRVITKRGPGNPLAALTHNAGLQKKAHATLSFDTAEVKQNNLGGVGPDGGTQELRIGPIGTLGSDTLDVVLTTEGPYEKANSNSGQNGMHGGFAKINVRACSSATIKFQFQLSSTKAPVVLDHFTSTFFDLDRGSKALEKLVVSGFDEVYLHDDSNLEFEADGDSTSYSSTIKGNAPNPADPLALSAEQEKHSAGFKFSNADGLKMVFDIPCSGSWATNQPNGGRNMMFSFESSMVPPPPEPMPSDVSEITLGCQASGAIESAPDHYMNGDALLCVRNLCGEPPGIDGASAHPYLYYFGDAVSYHCDHGLTVDGTPGGATTWSVTCQEDGTFSPPLTTACVAPQFSVGGKISDATNMSPLAGVSLKFTRPDGTSETLSTNAQGLYDSLGPMGEVTFEASKEGYIAASKLLFVQGDIPASAGLADLVLSPVLPADGWRVVLSWNQDPPDLDSHLYFGSGLACEIFYGRRSMTCPSGVGATLDVDDTNGQGPETTTIERFSGSRSGKAVFKVYNYYPTADFAASDAVAKVYHGDSLAGEFKVNDGGGVWDGQWWSVFSIDGPSETITPCTNLACT
jgi:hypothetical protein